MVLRRRERERGLAVGDEEERQLLALHELLDQHLGPGLAEAVADEHVVDRGLGLGAQPPTPEWGTMLADALQFYQRAWWLLAFPGLAILVTVMAFNLLGDGLRDALDPKLRR